MEERMNTLRTDLGATLEEFDRDQANMRAEQANMIAEYARMQTVMGRQFAESERRANARDKWLIDVGMTIALGVIAGLIFRLPISPIP